MSYLITFVLTSWLALHGHPLGAAFFWCVAIALLHAFEESSGEFWTYLAKRSGGKWRRGSTLGFAFIVFPALALQGYTAWHAFMGDELDPYWLALLIGARVGDALFSHAIPFAKDREANPGLPSAAVYIVDSLLLALLWHVPLMGDSYNALFGLALGAGLFVAVLPGLRLTRGFLTAFMVFACISIGGCKRTPDAFDHPWKGKTKADLDRMPPPPSDESAPMGLGNSAL